MDRKEHLVFVLSASDFSASKGGYSMDIWNDHERNGDELPPEAIEFMDLARAKNRVYSLKGFMVEININEDITDNDYVFITQAY